MSGVRIPPAFWAEKIDFQGGVVMISVEPDVEKITFADFLESIPPNQTCAIDQISVMKPVKDEATKKECIYAPQIQLHCSHESCNGIRIFRISYGNETRVSTNDLNCFIKYSCSNCRQASKTFALIIRANDSDYSGWAHKIGEYPPYGPPVPARLVKLIGPDRELFLKGRRCENQGLGVGAFVYYRRVVEEQKSRILLEIVKVGEKLKLSEEKLAKLRAASKESQFTKAIETAKDAMPESLLINGHNPLKLLYSALSEGVHALTDEKCLEFAESVRVVLGELSERLSQALKDEHELNKALTTLASIKQENK